MLKSKLPKPALGAYGLIVHAEAASDEAMAKFVLSLAAKGNLGTTTVEVFPEAEYETIVTAIASAARRIAENWPRFGGVSLLLPVALEGQKAAKHKRDDGNNDQSRT